MSGILSLYHHLPYPARCLAASLRGSQLARQRYSSHTESLAAEAIERETWSEDQWEEFRRQRLENLLHRAATRVPYYRELWRRRRTAGDERPWTRLEHWPILEKETVRRHPERFLADDLNRRRLVPEHTSGSTGTPLRIWRSREANIAWYALVEARLRRWHGVRRGEPWALVGGQLVTAVDRRRPPYWVWCRSQQQLYLSAYHLAPGVAGDYLDAMRKYGVRHLLGYPSALDALATFAQEEGAEAAPLEVVLGNAEPLFEHQRQRIRRTFGGPVRDSYGMAEMVVAASECTAGALHLWPEVGVLELLRNDLEESVEAGKPGRVVATGLLDDAMPLIRYEVGDRAVAEPSGETCSCGRTLPRLRSVEGRMDDVIVTPDGRRVGRLDPVFKADLSLRESQIVQTHPGRVVARLVPGEEFDAGVPEAVVDRLKQRLGKEMDIEVEVVESLPRTSAGKVRSVVSELGRAP